MSAFLLLIYGDPSVRDGVDPGTLEDWNKEYFTFGDGIRASGEWQSGAALQPTDAARTVRVRAGEPVHTHGPFAETQEVLGGFYLVECDSLDRAMELAARIPDARIGSVEVRPVLRLSGS